MKSLRKSRLLILMILMALLVLVVTAGCIPGDGKADAGNPAGFFWGIWHGWLAPISLIIGIVSRNIRVYETFNTGWWYDFGFYIAMIGGFGGFSLVRRNRSRSKHRDND